MDFASVADRCDNDVSLIFVEDYTPVADAKSHSVAPLEALHVAMAGRRDSANRLSIRRRISGDNFVHCRAPVTVKTIGFML